MLRASVLLELSETMDPSWSRREDLSQAGVLDRRDIQAQLVRTPWVSSWIGRARPGDRFDSDFKRRCGAWATWVMENLTEISTGDRHYPAIRLDGRFYDPKSQEVPLRPHLEIPARVLNRPDIGFVERLGLVGNGLAFAWFRYEEVTATRRALFNQRTGDLDELVEFVVARRLPLIAALDALNEQGTALWAEVERRLVDADEELADLVAGDFSVDDVEALVPGAGERNITVTFDTTLRNKADRWVSRRLGVWTVRAGFEPDETTFGVITPRLTANSLFRDPLFATTRESPGALLVRALVMRRLLQASTGTSPATVVEAATKPGGHLRAVVAQVGAKIPEAGPSAAVAFCQDHPEGQAAWAALNEWAGEKYLLTVTEDSFLRAHKRALRNIRRAEDPRRDDIDVILPLAWHDGRVVRATYHST